MRQPAEPSLTIKERPTPGLVLSGGGARGAYQAGVLRALAEAMPGPSPFSAITGVSVGAINAVVLAEGADDFGAAAKKLEALWRSLDTNKVFEARPWPMGKRLGAWAGAMAFGWAGLRAPRALLDASPLRQLIAEQVDFNRLAVMIETGMLPALAITASSYATGEAVTFFQGTAPDGLWTRSRRRGQLARLTVDHVMASAALPGIFEARRLGGVWYGDGALRQTAPLSPAIHLGCDRLLTIAARDGTPDDEPSPGEGEAYPTLGVLGGHLLDIVFNDNLDADRERLTRINATLHGMTSNRRAENALRVIGTEMIRPSQDIRALAGQHLHELPRTAKFLLMALGAMRAPFVLPSYLTFEPGYIGALIDLGRQDGRAAAPYLRSWMQGPIDAVTDQKQAG